MGIWQKRGLIITPSAADVSSALTGILNHTLMYEGSPQVISPNIDGNVFKLWYSAGGNKMGYAESNDCLSWTRFNTDGYLFSGAATASVTRIIKVASTYYMYGNLSPWSSVKCWTSSDGITWGSPVTVMGLGTGGNWDDENVEYFQPYMQVAGTWYAMYSATKTSNSVVATGIATCTTLTGTFTNAPSPAINGGSPGTINQIGGTWYCWMGAYTNPPTQAPNDLGRSSSSDGLTWSQLTANSITIPRFYLSEGASNSNGSLACPTMVEVSGTTYCVYTGTDHEDTGHDYMPYLCTAPLTMAQVVQTTEGLAAVQQFSDNFTRANEAPLVDAYGNPSYNMWIKPTDAVSNVQITSNKCVPAPNTGSGFAVVQGAVLPANQYAEITVQAVQTGGDIRVEARASLSVSGTNYFVQVLGVGASKSVKLFLVSAGSFTQLGATQTVTVTAGDVFRVECFGTRIRLLQNGTVLITATEATLSSGFVGISESANGTNTLTSASLHAAGILGATITGTLGAAGAGAAVLLTGTGYQSVTSDGSGNYTFTGVTDGAVTITPSRGGYSFSPANSAQTVSSTDISGVNFTTTINASTGLPVPYFGNTVD